MQVVLRHLVHDPKGRGINARSLSRCREARRGPSGGSSGARPSMESTPCPPSAAKVSPASSISPAPKTWEWLARICSTSVVPDRGSPTTKTGISLSKPKPRTRWKKSGVQVAIIRVTKAHTLSGRTPGRACATRPAAARCPVRGARRPRHTRPARPGLGPGRSAATSVACPSRSASSSRRRCAARSSSGSCPLRTSANLQWRKRSGDCAATRRGKSLPRPKIAHLLQSAAQVVVGLGKVRFHSSPGGSRRPPRPASSGPSGAMPKLP